MTMARAILAAADQPVAVPMQVAIEAALVEFGITSRNQVAGFLGQCAHESAGFGRLEENLNYSAQSLMAVWPRRFPPELAARVARKPQEIAEIAYAGRMGNTEAGDGWRFRGRGLIQITGRNNYRLTGQALGLDLLGNPDLLLRPEAAARSAALWWSTNGCAPLAEAADWVRLSKRINQGNADAPGEPHGLADRLARINRVLAVL
jgi:putative chitinase